MELTQKSLKNVLHYDPETGIFTWAKQTSRRIKVGDRAGTKMTIGYRNIGVLGCRIYEHQLAFLFMEGEIPKSIDHINRDKSDNRWENLRPASPSQNMVNRGGYRNKTGFRGVEELPSGRFRAKFTIQRKTVHIGVYDTAEQANQEYLNAVRNAHGRFI